MHGWQHEISGDHGTSTQAMKVTTLYDRFLGFSNLKNPDNWQPFGVEQSHVPSEYRYEDPTFSHDMISRFIFKWGYVPATMLVCVVGVLLWKVHSVIFGMNDKLKKQTTLILGANCAVLFSLAAGSYVFQFPANVFLWIFTTLTLLFCTKYNEEGEGSYE
ncbi:hypothetical protein [Rubritalea tangerina]|uniref:hypothetical protein n=1 Tax=Rubritalea tangerina TaxID=430798 RepID=UPI003612E841